MQSEQKILTVQVYWNYQWHDAGSVRFPNPKTGLTGDMTFTYNGKYVNEVTTAKEGLSFKDERAIGHNVPGHLMKGYSREPVARTTVWPQEYQHSVYEPNYDKIIRDFAEDPDITRVRFIAELEKLAGLRKKVAGLGAPGRVLEHKNIVFERPERFLETLRNESGGGDAQNATKV